MPVRFTIRTEILPPDPQAGMKSEQTLVVNFSSRTVTTSFRTGTTSVGPITLESVRDKFRVYGVVFRGTTVNFGVIGQTASGVIIMPNIDYKMQFEVHSTGSGTVQGTHDGYPAYFVRRGARLVHHYRHKPMRLWRLLGSRDIKFGPNSF